MATLYTIAMSYLEGTYIAQVESNSVEDAIRAWPAKLNVDQIEGLSLAGYGQLSRTINRSNPEVIALDGLKSVWYVDFLIDGELMGVNIIQTQG